MSQHFLTGAELNHMKILILIDQAIAMKQSPQEWSHALKGKHLAMLFDKPSLRTRFSFGVAMQSMGGHFIEALDTNRKKETPEDLINVLQGYCQAVMIRTFHDEFVQKMAAVSKIPIINGLTDLYHPCQILADLMTLKEHFSSLDGLTITYIGDGNNILHSLLLMAHKMSINVHYCCPKNYQPKAEVVDAAINQSSLAYIKCFDDPKEAVSNADAVYTDVWNSMGYADRDESAFEGFQVNEAMIASAKPEAVFMHCMPINRGQEVSEALPDSACSLVFKQSENRLHAQKSLLLSLLA